MKLFWVLLIKQIWEWSNQGKCK